MKRFFLYIFVLFLCASNVFASNLIPPTHPNIKYVGRVSFSKHASPNLPYSDKVRFSFPGIQIRTVFEGTSLKMLMKPNSGYYMVEIDNMAPYKVHCSETDSVMEIVNNLRNEKHNVCITMANEGNIKRPAFFGFILDDGCTLPEAPKLPSRKIEFIGNSITCGYGVEGKSGKEHFNFSTENQYYAYDAITARNLNAQAMVVARSGMGVYRNCGGKATGDKIVLPTIYPYTIFGEFTEPWDFKKFVPDVVCINLGTNDTSSTKCDSSLFVLAYCKFIHTIRGNYPRAKIVILSGTMIKKDSKRDITLRGYLDKVWSMLYDEGDKNIYRFDLTPENGTMGYGSDFHPSMQRQQYAANELTAYLKELMNW